MDKKISRIPLAILSCLFLLLQYLLFTGYSAQQPIYPGWSLRYQSAKTSSDVSAAETHLNDNAADYEDLRLHYWSEWIALLYGDLDLNPTGANASCIAYFGDPGYVFPMDLQYGRAPGEFETESCAISTTLSWSLWRSLDSVGRTVQLGNKTYTVCGVYQSEESIMLFPGEATTDWYQIEVTGTDMTREKLDQFLQNCGLGAPDSIIDGAALSDLWRIIIILPVVLLFLTLLWLLLDLRQSRNMWRSAILFLACLFSFVFLLPTLLQQLPPWLIPGQWSDFTFWANLIDSLRSHARSFFSAASQQKDLIWKLTALKNLTLLLLQCLVLALLNNRLSALLLNSFHKKTTPSSATQMAISEDVSK